MTSSEEIAFSNPRLEMTSGGVEVKNGYHCYYGFHDDAMGVVVF